MPRFSPPRRRRRRRRSSSLLGLNWSIDWRLDDAPLQTPHPPATARRLRIASRLTFAELAATPSSTLTTLRDYWRRRSVLVRKSKACIAAPSAHAGGAFLCANKSPAGQRIPAGPWQRCRRELTNRCATDEVRQPEHRQ